MRREQLLKKDLFGEIWRVSVDDEAAILRDTSSARWWLAWLARALLRREARALLALSGNGRVPEVLKVDKSQLLRSYLPGTPLYGGATRDPDYFRSAHQLLRQMHRASVVHNDLAKEPNLLVLHNGSPAFIDFQLAWYAPGRGRLFRVAAREDIRHLLKHKRMYLPEQLTAREQRILATPSLPARIWMSLWKPAYLFVTRRLFGWSDREGAGDRGRQD